MSSKLTPKGMRDFSPKDLYLRNIVISKIQAIFDTYGFRPIQTPSLEYVSTLTAKSGDEVSSQIFVIEGGEYGLRFDLTVPLARYLSADDSPRPFKRCVIDRVWRKEEPQRGRFREFYQADADIVGSSSMRSEIELLNLGLDVCKAFGFNSPRILLNNRKILDAIAASLDLGEKKFKVFRILDKLDKIGPKEVESLLESEIGSKSKELLKLINSGKTNSEKLDFASKISKEGADELRQIVSEIPNVEIDLSLVRGLGYYTGPIFEFKLSDKMGTVLSGGRYDGLLGIYGKDECAVGISVGVERLITLFEENENYSNKNPTKTKIFIASTSDQSYKKSLEIASILRSSGLCIETDISSRSLKKQLEYSNSFGIPIVIIAGDKDLQNDLVTLKDMRNSDERKIKTGEILQCIKSLNLS